MNATRQAIYNDLESLSKNFDLFPRELRNETLEYLKDNDELDLWMRRDAANELTIRKHGIALVAISEQSSSEEYLKVRGPDALDHRRPDFVYSLGMERLGLPEMLSFYPSTVSCHWIMNAIYQRMLDGELKPPTSPTDLVPVRGLFDNPNMAVVLSLLSPEERAWAYKEHTCQFTSEETPVMVLHIPYPNGQFDWNLIPDELLGGMSN